jgi:NitT/TauT family transport system ATP-binding protein
VKEIVPVHLPRPRDQIATKELAEFTHLRGHVYRLIKREQVDTEVADAGLAVAEGGT